MRVIFIQITTQRLKELSIAEDTLHFRQKNWRTFTGSDLKAFTLRTSLHNIGKYYASFQGTEAINTPK